MLNSVTEKGFAKLNLSLSILGRTGEFHLLEMLDQTVDLFDLVSLSPRNDGEVVSNIEGDNSIAVLKALQTEFSLGGMSVSVQKNIPVGGGLGGSSADAAAAAIACAKLFSLPLERVKEIAAPMFGDIAFQMTNGTAIARGMGEIVEPLPHLPPYPVLLCFPKMGVMTKDAFRLSEETAKRSANTLALYQALSRGERAQEFYSNDLIPAALSLCGEIRPLLERMEDPAALLTGMTGSGSTLFSVYRELGEATKAASKLPARTLITRFSKGI